MFELRLRRSQGYHVDENQTCQKPALVNPQKYIDEIYGQEILTAVEYPSLFWTRSCPEEESLQVLSSVSVSESLVVVTTTDSRFPFEQIDASIRYANWRAGAAAFQLMVTLAPLRVA
jgi:hypothetical protein